MTVPTGTGLVDLVEPPLTTDLGERSDWWLRFTLYQARGYRGRRMRADAVYVLVEQGRSESVQGLRSIRQRELAIKPAGDVIPGSERESRWKRRPIEIGRLRIDLES